MNEKRKWITAGRLRRGAAILGAVGLAAGAGLLTASSALAAVGTLPGDLVLNPTTGALTSTPTWSTTVACPANFQGSAEINEYNLAGTLISTVSGVVASPTAPISNALLLGNIGALLNTGGVNATTPGTLEWVVDCFSGAGGSGSQTHAMSTFVSVAAGATTYTTSSTGPVQTATTTTLSASPNPAAAGASVTLTATESPATAGSVVFQNGSTTIATVAVNASGVATTTFTAPSPFTSAIALTATFTPTNLTSFAGSSGSTTLNSSSVLTAGGTNPVVINVTVAQSGTLTVTVAPGPVSLTVSGSTGTGALPNVSILDTRNFFPGWSVSGQESAFTSSATPSTPISGNQLGWTPAPATGSATFDGTHVLIGSPVTAGSPGLGTTAAVLALAHAGFGADPTGATTYMATAALTLAIPVNTTAGAYTGNLTITYLTSQA
jgi:large repetitive protein